MVNKKLIGVDTTENGQYQQFDQSGVVVPALVVASTTARTRP